MIIIDNFCIALLSVENASGARKSLCCVDIPLEPGSSCNAQWSGLNAKSSPH